MGADSSAGEAGDTPGSTGGDSGGQIGGGNGGTVGATGAAGMAGQPEEPPDLCVGKMCDAPPADDCQSATQFQTYDKTGTCAAGECSYVPHAIACTCEAQACTTDPCIGVPCATPPGAICKDANTLTTYAASGTCSGGSCTYAPADSTCAFGCANGACKADPCATRACNMPPSSTCEDAGTRTTYAASGTCSAGKCNYAATNTPCSGATALCKDSGTSSQCVACLANTDCSNGGTCSTAGACVCTSRFNGKHCEFQAFRGVGALQGDTASVVYGISHDGSVVFGTSLPAPGGLGHAFRSVNGAALQFIAEPSSLTPVTGCYVSAVDSSGTLLLFCEGRPFLYTPTGGAVAIDWPVDGNVLGISLDGKVLVGDGANQAFRKAGSVGTSLGVLEPGAQSQLRATNGDGSVAVGYDYLAKEVGVRWTAADGLVALAPLSDWGDNWAQGVSTDGKVIVGVAIAGSATLAVKWSGTDLAPTVLGHGQASGANLDGSVITGIAEGSATAMIWDNGGAHTVQALIASSPDLTSDWLLKAARGVSDDGKFVVGSGTHGAHIEGWIAHLP